MFVKNFFSPRLLSQLKGVTAALFLLASLVFLVVCVKMLAHFGVRSHSFELTGRDLPGKRAKLDYSLIGKGALALEGAMGSFSVPDLSREITFASNSRRPDLRAGDEKLVVSLKGSGECREVASGSKHFLTYGEGDRVSFSSTETPLWFEPTLRGDGSLSVEVVLHLDSKKAIHERSSFVLKGSHFDDVEEAEPLALLLAAKWLSPDKLLDLYGDAEFVEQKGRERLVLGEKRLYVSPGDLLVFDRGWRKVLAEETEGKPLAQVKEIAAGDMVIEFWDASGLTMREVILTQEMAQLVNFRLDETFKTIRQRTASVVSCRLGEKKTLLKVGDWVLRGEEGWRILRSWDEVEKTLEFALEGELFVFDGVEKTPGGALFTGHLFDATRSSVQNVKLSLSPKEKKRSGRSYGGYGGSDDDDDDEDFDDDFAPVNRRHRYNR